MSPSLRAELEELAKHYAKEQPYQAGPYYDINEYYEVDGWGDESCFEPWDFWADQ